MKTCGWLMWASVMALGYGFGWKTAWELLMSGWNFAAWNGFDWVMFMGGLLLDQNWQVRDAAATALTKFGNDSIDIFLKILKYRDLYAKESICEEIEKTNFSSMLIENLASENREIQAKSREILHVMHSLHFSTPLREYLKRSKNEAIGQEIRLLINEGSEA